MTSNNYQADAIEVLKGLEPVRRRPGMYTDTTRPNHLGQEVIDNSVDEALAGHARSIQVILHEDQSLEVIDDGRGMPVDIHPEEGVPAYYDLLVMKQWVDAGTTAKRPDSIEVSLLRDGVVYDTQTIRAADSWRYTWTNLSNQFVWSAIETTRLADYTVRYQRSATTLVIVNTARSISTDDDDNDKDIPKTGLDWWPIDLLAVAGVVLFTIGWRKRFGAGGKHHAS